jgi:hypothetical protein
MARAALGVAIVLASLFASAKPTSAERFGPDPNLSPSYRILNRAKDGEEVRLSHLMQRYAQDRSDKLFATLSPLLGGDAPRLNFQPTGSPFTPNNSSANLTDRIGAPKGTINFDPLAVEALINDGSPFHNSGVNNLPHEFSHTRQTPQTLAQLLTREGGAQAFTDIVTPAAANRAKIPYRVGNYDGDYADYVKAVQQPPYGRDWILAGQFGRTGSPAWP